MPREPEPALVEQQTMELGVEIPDDVLEEIKHAAPSVTEHYADLPEPNADVTEPWMRAVIFATTLGKKVPAAKTERERVLREKLIQQTKELQDAGKRIDVPSEFVEATERVTRDT